MSSKSHIISADITRIVAIIAVVAIHVATPFVDYPPFFAGPSWWIANLIDSVSRIAVPLFIMLSGFLLLDVNKPTKLKKRLLRIGIPFLIWNTIYILWNIVFWFKSYTPISLISSLFKPDIYHHLYFLNIMLGLYFIIPILKRYISTVSLYKQYLLLGLYFLGITAITFNNYFSSIFNVSFNALTLFIPYIFYFLSGYYLRNIKINKKQVGFLILLFTLLISITAIGNYHFMKMIGWSNQFSEGARYDRYFYDYFNPIIICMAWLSFVFLKNIQIPIILVKKKKIIAWMQFIATTSFGIFLLHPIILDLTDRYIPPLNIANMSNVIGIVLLIKIIVVFTLTFSCVALWEIIKKRTFN